MAQAAEDTFAFVRLQTLIGVIGTIALVITIYYTARATRAASKAAIAAEKSVELTADTAKRQLRAYITITSCDAIAGRPDGAPPPKTEQWTILRTGCCPIAVLAYTNTGQTPAHDIRIEGEAKLMAWPLDEAQLVATPFAAGSSNIIGRDGGREVRLIEANRSLLTAQQNNELRNEDGALAFVAFGKISYKDVFDCSWETNFRYFTGGPVPIVESRIGMSAHDRGNKAT